ncbi:MAG: hypothetical protein L6455_07550 [Kiritimatiellae bacterium]|nr:hypothetical protein [Verrucomicrobiota bacterium]MCG2679805.1 hypothetical protein [Kiritimatiellia bacterium]
MKKTKITIRSLVLGTLFAALFAAVSVFASNISDVSLTGCQIAVAPYLLLIVMVLLLNPLCRLIRVIRVFSTVEILVIFLMGSVSSGLANNGLVQQIMPMAGSLFYGDWNNPQSEWNRHIVPFVNEAYFVSEPGIQKAAGQYYRAYSDNLDQRKVYEAAGRVRNTRERIAETETEIRKIQAEAALTAEKKAVKNSELKAVLENDRQVLAEEELAWQELVRTMALPPPEEVLRLFPAQIEQSKGQVLQTRSALAALESKAFEKVALFRRGLPRGLSAYPGILPMREDDAVSYFARLRRLVNGMAALHDIKEGLRLLNALPPAAPPAYAVSTQLKILLQHAQASLQPLSGSVFIKEHQELLRKEGNLINEECEAMHQQFSALKKTLRNAKRGQLVSEASLVRSIESKIKNLKRLERRQTDIEIVRKRNDLQLTCAQNVQTLMDSFGALQADLQTGRTPVADIRERLNGFIPVLTSMDVSIRRYFVGEIPWQHWLRPLVRWTILSALTYIVLMALNVLIFRQWVYNEMLTYPLAELPKALIGDTESDGLIPALYHNNLFWIGVAVSSGIMGWNLLCASQVIPGLDPMNLSNSWRPYVFNTKFEALGRTQTSIFFVMIGLTFLIPKNISFSLWFFHVLYLVQILLLDWSGRPSGYSYNWWYLLNFRTAEGQGALMVFSAMVLFKCRKYILCAFTPSAINGLEAGERKELKLASIAFLGGSLALIMQLWLDMGANLFYTIFFYFMVILLTIGMVRAVAEGGLLTVKTHVSPFHVIRAFLGLDQKYSQVSLFTPLIIYCGVMFLDIKEFVAPAMANALKLRNDYHIKRGVFHLAIALCLIAAAAAAFLTVMLMAYSCGADNMNNWFYTGLPRWTMFHTMRGMVTDAPIASPAGQLWLCVGGGAMAALLYFRQLIFWLPHPLGLVMYVNPTMHVYWFSILIGWIGNIMVTKYGNKDTYHRARGFFIGLIIGELLIAILSMMISVDGFDLDKY